MTYYATFAMRRLKQASDLPETKLQFVDFKAQYFEKFYFEIISLKPIRIKIIQHGKLDSAPLLQLCLFSVN